MTTDRKNIIDEDILYVFDMEGENRAFSRKSVLAGAGDEYFGDDYSYDEYELTKTTLRGTTHMFSDFVHSFSLNIYCGR